jgi:GTP-sensing pleiotropic transcriptional regulator CodY
MALTSNAVYKSNVNGAGPATSVVTLSKSSISESEAAAAIKAAVEEGNTIAGVIADTNVVTVLIQGAGITDGSNYGAAGVTSATTLTFE